MATLTAGNNIGILIKADADTGAITATTTQLDAMGAAAEKNAAKSATSFDSFNKTLGTVGKSAEATGKSLSTYLTAPIVGVGYESVKMAVNFQQTMEMLHTNAGTAQDAIAGLSQSVLDMASQVGAKPEDLAKGLYHIASAGNGIWSTAQQLDILKIAAEGAAIGQANLDDTTYALTSTMASNIKGAETASSAMGILTATVGAGDMKMGDLNAAIGTGFLGTAASFGISLQSVGAALATLTDNGEHADAAATRLRMTWALMASPSKQATKMLSDLGLTSTDAAASVDAANKVFAQTGLSTTKLATDLQQPNGMNVAMRDIAQHIKDAGLNASETDAILAKAFGGGRTDAAMLTMLQNLDRTDTKFQAINASAGDFSEKWASQQETANQQFKQAWAGIEADLIKLGDEILPTVTKDFNELAHYVQDVSNWFNGLNQEQKNFVIHAAEVTLAVGPALMIFGKIATTLSTVGKGFSMVSKAMGFLKFAPLAEEGAGLTEALAGGGGLLAALGPVGLGIGAVALAAGGGYLAIKAFNNMGKENADALNEKVSPAIQNYWNLAKDLGVTLQGAANGNTLLGLSQQEVANDTAMVKAATSQINDLQKKQTDQTVVLKQKNDDLAGAQKGVKDALDKFGQSSPQYYAALDTLRQKQEDYNGQLNTSIGFSLDLQNKEGLLKQAQDNLKASTGDLGDIQKYLNGQLDSGVGVVARFGPTALAQVGGIQVLQGAIGQVVASWSSASSDIQINAPRLATVIQGVGSTINHVQGQSDYLNSTLSAAKNSAMTIQGSMGNIQGGSLQGHATGTNYFRGGATWVGENGPEIAVLPTGSQIKTNGQSMHSNTTNSHSVTIHTLILPGVTDTTSFMNALDQDTTLLGKGLTANRGAR